MRFMMLLPAPAQALEKFAVPSPDIVLPMRTDGPFAEAKEVIAGFWIIQVKSKEEAVEWAKRCPLPENGLIEIRQVFENSDFPPELQKKTA